MKVLTLVAALTISVNAQAESWSCFSEQKEVIKIEKAETTDLSMTVLENMAFDSAVIKKGAIAVGENTQYYGPKVYTSFKFNGGVSTSDDELGEQINSYSTDVMIDLTRNGFSFDLDLKGNVDSYGVVFLGRKAIYCVNDRVGTPYID